MQNSNVFQKNCMNDNKPLKTWTANFMWEFFKQLLTKYVMIKCSQLTVLILSILIKNNPL